MADQTFLVGVFFWLVFHSFEKWVKKVSLVPLYTSAEGLKSLFV